MHKTPHTPLFIKNAVDLIKSIRDLLRSLKRGRTFGQWSEDIKKKMRRDQEG